MEEKRRCVIKEVAEGGREKRMVFHMQRQVIRAIFFKGTILGWVVKPDLYVDGSEVPIP